MKIFMLLAFLLLSAPGSIYSQSLGSLLIVSDVECTVSVNGEPKIDLETNKPHKCDLTVGEHYLVFTAGANEKSEIVEVVASQQKVYKVSFGSAGEGESEPETRGLARQNIANLEVDLAGGIEIGAAISDGAAEEDYYPSYSYALQKDDILLLDVELLNKNGSFNLVLTSYADKNEIFSQQKLQNLEKEEIRIPQDGVYTITVSNNHVLGKKIKFNVSRIPANEESAKKKTEVRKCMKYTVVKLQEPSSQWVNSTSNETWKGGTNEVTIPVKLPANTVEWYYVISASRSQADIDRNLKNAGLFKQLTKYVGGISPTTMVLNIGLDIISQPPGSNYCDVYLLDYQNNSLFSNDEAFSYVLEGSRENVTAAKVKIKGINSGQYYLGIQNRDAMNGLGVAIEVVAIVGETYWGVGE